MDWQIGLSNVCHCFHGQILKCNCICNLMHEELVSIKDYFKNLVDVFWLDDHHIVNRTKAEEIGTCLGHFLLPSCTLNSQRPEFQFLIGENNTTHSVCQLWPRCLDWIRNPVQKQEMSLPTNRQSVWTCTRLQLKSTSKIASFK